MPKVPRSLKQQQSWTILLVMFVREKSDRTEAEVANLNDRAIANVEKALEGRSALLWILSHAEMTTDLHRTSRRIQTGANVTTQPIPANIDLHQQTTLVDTLRSEFVRGPIVIVTTSQLIQAILRKMDPAVDLHPYNNSFIHPGAVSVLELVKAGQEVTFSLKKVIH